MGQIKATVISSILELASKVGFSVALSRMIGYVGIWYASPLGWVIGLAMSAGYFYFGKWKQRALEADAKAA
jgi:Na+-driven multidrug efflux pump